MWRTALRPRWLALLALVLVMASGMAWLGNWQLARAREQGSAAQRARVAVPPVPLTEALAAQTRFPSGLVDRPVTVSGTWDGARQLLLPGRWREGREGYWVLTPLALADGAVIGVVRGWTATPDAATPDAAGPGALPAGEVTVTGVLRPGEESPPYEPGRPPALPAGQLGVIDPVDLMAAWPGRPYAGYVLATYPDGATPPPGLEAVPPAAGNGKLALQNLSYAVQWWLFAAFGLALWYRLVRDDHRGVLSGAKAAARSGRMDP